MAKHEIVLDLLNSRLLAQGSMNAEIEHLISGCKNYERTQVIENGTELKKWLTKLTDFLNKSEAKRDIHLLMTPATRHLLGKYYYTSMENQYIPEILVTDVKLRCLIIVVEKITMPDSTFGPLKVSHFMADVSQLYTHALAKIEVNELKGI